ncbi:hypothetical protein EX30DRAFT_378701 [Ascodesmis nigricans]|uniref:Uncharacterized protein n=1 Tax=Ascodesmis nigricans TaxID=341454 RepID=A0A4S2MW34_9PEZI|nr:hypothetical protein EX30DRAFT_378701 [Ascodesmis nigricans]
MIGRARWKSEVEERGERASEHAPHRPPRASSDRKARIVHEIFSIECYTYRIYILRQNNQLSGQNSSNTVVDMEAIGLAMGVPGLAALFLKAGLQGYEILTNAKGTYTDVDHYIHSIKLEQQKLQDWRDSINRVKLSHDPNSPGRERYHWDACSDCLFVHHYGCYGGRVCPNCRARREPKFSETASSPPSPI